MLAFSFLVGWNGYHRIRYALFTFALFFVRTFCPWVDELLATGVCSLDGLRTLIVPKERRRTFADVVSLYKALRLAGVLKQKISTARRYIQ
jgi:hypothetical protein